MGNDADTQLPCPGGRELGPVVAISGRRGAEREGGDADWHALRTRWIAELAGANDGVRGADCQADSAWGSDGGDMQRPGGQKPTSRLAGGLAGALIGGLVGGLLGAFHGAWAGGVAAFLGAAGGAVAMLHVDETLPSRRSRSDPQFSIPLPAGLPGLEQLWIRRTPDAESEVRPFGDHIRLRGDLDRWGLLVDETVVASLEHLAPADFDPGRRTLRILARPEGTRLDAAARAAEATSLFARLAEDARDPDALVSTRLGRAWGERRTALFTMAWRVHRSAAEAWLAQMDAPELRLVAAILAPEEPRRLEALARDAVLIPELQVRALAAWFERAAPGRQADQVGGPDDTALDGVYAEMTGMLIAHADRADALGIIGAYGREEHATVLRARLGGPNRNAAQAALRVLYSRFGLVEGGLALTGVGESGAMALADAEQSEGGD